MRSAPKDSACGITVTLDPTATRRLGHPVHTAPVGADDRRVLAESLASGEWELLDEYGMMPVWMFARLTEDPLRVAEFKYGTMLLHVFPSEDSRDEYLDNLDINLFEDMNPAKDRMPQQARSSESDFTLGSSSGWG